MNKIILQNKINESNKKRIINIFEKKIKLNDNNELIIGTTAITRPELHNISFSNYAKFIPKDIPIKWIINVDYVNFNNEIKDKNISITDTIENIKKFFKNHNIQFIFISSIQGNFNKAVRTVVNNIFENISKSTKYILYLEDDWFIENDIDFKQLINNAYDVYRLNRKETKINNSSISFQPSLLKPFVWYLVFYVSLQKNNDFMKDPEKICQKNNNFIEKYNITYNAEFYFIDIGRNFLDNNSNLIRGWFQKTNELNLSMSYIDTDILFKSIIYQYKIKKNKSNIDNFSINIKNKLKSLFIQSLLVIVNNNFDDKVENYYNYYCNLTINKKLDDINSIYKFIQDEKNLSILK